MPTILIVDDDAALRDSLAETVHDLGHKAQLERIPVRFEHSLHGEKSSCIPAR